MNPPPFKTAAKLALFGLFLVLFLAAVTSCAPVRLTQPESAARRSVIVSEPIFVSPTDGRAVPYRRTRIVTLP